MSRWGEQYVYFAEACGRVKIGCSNDPETRIRTVGEWVPHPITLLAVIPGSFELEASIHAMFDADWSHGEWFNLTADLRTFIDRAAAGQTLGIDTTKESARRKAYIADKKRIQHRITRLRKAGGRLPARLDMALREVPKGIPIPPKLLAEVNGLIDAYLTSTERTVGKAA